MPYEVIAPEWNAQGIEPPQSLKDSGWQFNQKPPADYFNWFFYNTARAIIELQLEAINTDQKGATNGVAPLVGGKVPNSFLNIAAPADASLTIKGIVMLDSSTASESETKAATPKAVKTIADSLATHAGNASIHVNTSEKNAWNAKETTSGAQAKADAAVASAKTYTDQQDALLIPMSQKGAPFGVATLGSDGKVPANQLNTVDASTTQKGVVQLSNATDSTSETLAATPKSVKDAKDGLSTQIGILSDKTDDLKTAKTNKDANGIYTTVTYRRKSNDSLFATSILSGGTSPSYTTRTVTYYEVNGTTVRKTVTFTLSYDADGVLVSEV